jgi:protein TonB
MILQTGLVEDPAGHAPCETPKPMLLDSVIRERLRDPPDGGASPVAPVRLPPDGGVEAAVPPLTLVPEKPAPVPREGSRWLSPATGIGSVLLHGTALAAFLALATPKLPQLDLPSVEVELVEPDAEPPAAAAAPAVPAETPPTAEIPLPALEDMPLPAELTPQVTEAKPPPVELSPPDTTAPPLPAELTPPEQPAVDPATVTIDPPPVAELPLPAELTPPPRREETPRVGPVPQPRQTSPARREQARPPVQRERTEREPPRRQPPPAARPPSAASAGRGVTSQGPARSATPPPSYLGQVMARLQRARPAGTGQQGRAVVRFSILRSGAVGAIGLAASSGNSIVDQAALAMVRRAAPFPPLPPEFGPATMPLTVPVNFR